MTETDTGSSDSFFTLDYEKFLKLRTVLEQPAEIHSRHPDYPSVSVRPVDLVNAVGERILKLEKPILHDVRLNGSAATWVVGNSRDSSCRPYNDVDLIFHVDIPIQELCSEISTAAVLGFADAVRQSGVNLPCFNGAGMNPYELRGAYCRKHFEKWQPDPEGDHWYLLTFHNIDGLDLELKFVSDCRRPYEFSVDSFQVVLDSYVALWQLSKLSPAKSGPRVSSPRIFPTVKVESKWGNAEEALRHVNERWIATRTPETVRGGGLLKYCRLLVQGYRPAYSDLRRMEQYMCSRFFIDFYEPEMIYAQISKYLSSHYRQYATHYACASKASAFLWTLLQVVEISAKCMAVDLHRKVMHTIAIMACYVEKPFLAGRQYVAHQRYDAWRRTVQGAVETPPHAIYPCEVA